MITQNPFRFPMSFLVLPSVRASSALVAPVQNEFMVVFQCLTTVTERLVGIFRRDFLHKLGFAETQDLLQYLYHSLQNQRQKNAANNKSQHICV